MSMQVSDSKSYLHNERNGGDVEAQSGCWKRLTGLEKKLVYLIIFLSLVAISLAIALGVVESQKKDSTSTDVDICSTPECQAAGKRLKSAMNMNVSPCKDFYEYACGGWMTSTTIPDDKGRWGVFDDLRDQLSDTCVALLQDPTQQDSPQNAIDNTRAFYQECVATEKSTKDDGNSALVAILKSIGGMPLIQNTEYTEKTNWLSRSITVRNQLGMNILITFQVSIDIKNPAGYIIYLDQASSFGLGRLILKDMTLEKNKVYLDAYKAYIRSTLCLLNSKDPCEDDFEKTEIENLIQFESKMVELTKDPVLRRDPNVWYVKMSVSQLQQKVPELPVPWLQYINEILDKTTLKVNASTEIVVKEEKYLKDIIQLIKQTSPKTIANYLGWRVLQEIGPYSSKEFRVNEFNFQKVTTGIQQQKPITDKCFGITNNFFGYAVGRLYVEKHFSKEAKADIDSMESNVAKAFRILLAENKWMDDNTKVEAYKKLDLMKGMLAYPEWIEDSKKLDEYYQHLLSTLVRDKYIETLKNVLTSATVDELKKLTSKTDREKEWISPPTIVNAFYSPSRNTITFPAGILQPPFYQHNTLHALNYGAIGYVIGHEITHGYDDQGSEYNGIGKLESWWSNETRNEYNGNKECFINQYSAIQVKFKDETLNLKGNQTIGENIADNGGIREAFEAYRLTRESSKKRLPGLEDLNPEKLFFLSAANIWCSKFRDESLKDQINNGVHSPGQFRATIPLANTNYFAEVFQCPKGSEMNPADKCLLW